MPEQNSSVSLESTYCDALWLMWNLVIYTHLHGENEHQVGTVIWGLLAEDAVLRIISGYRVIWQNLLDIVIPQVYTVKS
jgi:hypothetical protein